MANVTTLLLRTAVCTLLVAPLPVAAQTSAACSAVKGAMEAGSLPEDLSVDTGEVAEIVDMDVEDACMEVAEEAGLTVVDTSGPSACAALQAVMDYDVAPAGFMEDADEIAAVLAEGQDPACGEVLDEMGYGAGVAIADCAQLVQIVSAGDLPLDAQSEAGQMLVGGLTGTDPAECSEAVGELEAAAE